MSLPLVKALLPPNVASIPWNLNPMEPEVRRKLGTRRRSFGRSLRPLTSFQRGPATRPRRNKPIHECAP